MAIKDLLIRLGVKGDKKAKQKIKGVENGLGSLGKSAIKAGAAFFGARALIDGMKQSIQLAGIQEQAEKRLEVALGKRSKALLQQASALQQQTTFGDEAIIGVQASIGAFVKSEEQIKKATSATLDMAVAMGMDLKASGDLIAKTLGSSTNALSRYGIEVKGAVGSSERLESLTNNIAKLFGGQATAQAQTFAGSIEQMQNAIGDTAETLGTIMQPVIQASAVGLKKFAETLDTSLESFKKIDLKKTGENFLKSTDALMKAVSSIFKIYIDFLPDFWMNVFNKLLPIAKNIFNSFLNLVQEVALIVWEPLVISLNHVGERIKQGFVFLINEGILNPLNFLTEKINSVATKLGFDEIKPFNLLEKVQVDPLLEKLEETKIGKFIIPTEDDIQNFSDFAEASSEIWSEYLAEITVLNEENKEEEIETHKKGEEKKRDENKKTFTEKMKDHAEGQKELMKLANKGFQLGEAIYNKEKVLRDNAMNQEIDAILNSKRTEEEKESAIANIKEKFRQEDLASKRKMQGVKKFEAIANTALGVTNALAQPGNPKKNILESILIGALGAVEVATIDAQKFARGGIVQGVGNQDTVPAMLTPGELILNQAQQENLAGNNGITINIGGNIIGEESFVRDTLIPEIEKAQVLA